MASSVSYPLQLSYVTPDHAALYEESLKHPEQFWGDLAKRRLRWIKEFDQVMDCDMRSGQFKWFLGGVINVSGEICYEIHTILYSCTTWLELCICNAHITYYFIHMYMCIVQSRTACTCIVMSVHIGVLFNYITINLVLYTLYFSFVLHSSELSRSSRRGQC